MLDEAGPWPIIIHYIDHPSYGEPAESLENPNDSTPDGPRDYNSVDSQR
jgi:hypothetical protein